jgi:cobalt/nickel transport system permease protein
MRRGGAKKRLDEPLRISMGVLERARNGLGAIEQLSRRDSTIHRLHPAAKTFVTMLFIVSVVSAPPGEVSALLPFILYPAIIAQAAGIPLRVLVSGIVPALPFIVFFGASNLILMREPILRLGAAVITRGMLFACSLLIKTMLTVSAAILLTAATPFTELAACLTAPRGLRIFGLQVILTIRYISVLIGEAASMSTAYTLRGGSRRIQFAHIGPFLGRLLVRSFDRGSRVYEAMLCRGFNGSYHHPSSIPVKWTAHSIFYIIATVLFFAAARFCNLAVMLGRLVLWQ